MIKAVSTLFAPLAVAMTLFLVALAPASAQDDGSCLSNRQLQSAIANGEIAPVAEVLENAGIDRSTEVLSVEACDEGGALSYFVGVLDPYGQATTLVLPSTGFEP